MLEKEVVAPRRPSETVATNDATVLWAVLVGYKSTGRPLTVSNVKEVAFKKGLKTNVGSTGYSVWDFQSKLKKYLARLDQQGEIRFYKEGNRWQIVPTNPDMLPEGVEVIEIENLSWERLPPVRTQEFWGVNNA